MMPIATALMWTAFAVGLLGIAGLLILLWRALRDWWDERLARDEAETPCACPRCRENKYTFNRHRLTP